MIYFIDLSSGSSGLVVVIKDDRSPEKNTSKPARHPFASFDFLSYPVLSFAYCISKKKENAYQVNPPMGINSFEHLVNADKKSCAS